MRIRLQYKHDKMSINIQKLIEIDIELKCTTYSICGIRYSIRDHDFGGQAMAVCGDVLDMVIYLGTRKFMAKTQILAQNSNVPVSEK